ETTTFVFSAWEPTGRRAFASLGTARPEQGMADAIRRPMGRSGVTSVSRAPEEPDAGMMQEMTTVDPPAVAIQGGSHCYGRASGARRRDLLHHAIDLRRSARPQRSWKEYVVLADHAPLRHPTRSYPDFRPRRRTCVERGFAHDRRRIPTTHARPRSLRDPESDLPCRLARHRQARRPRARR